MLFRSGALLEDADGDGRLGPPDRVLHAGPAPLHACTLASGIFDGRVVIVRPGRALRSDPGR